MNLQLWAGQRRGGGGGMGVNGIQLSPPPQACNRICEVQWLPVITCGV
jgi:hypothetical protein